MTKTPHKHAELIKAWADGELIDCFDGYIWQMVTKPTWIESLQYRIKPTQEPITIQIGYWHHGTGTFFKGAYLTPAQEQMLKSGIIKPVYTYSPSIHPEQALQRMTNNAVMLGLYELKRNNT